MSTIYEQRDAHFRHVSAYAILDVNRNHVANVMMKYPKDGAGRLYAYVHWFGEPMVRGSVTGYGYAKSDAAVSAAMDSVKPNGHPARDAFVKALAKDGGQSWQNEARYAGFTVLTAV